MKTNKIYALLACALLALVSCHEDDFMGDKWAPAKSGDEIRFGGTMSYNTTRTNLTRTVYGDKKTGDGGYTEIKWYEGDGVRIYCDKATLGNGETDLKYCEYGVTNYVEQPVYNGGTLTNPTESNAKDGQYETNHSSGLETRNGQPGLRWGTGTHTFYGVYPDSTQLAKYDAVAAKALKLSDGVLEGYLPNTQAPSRYIAPTTFSATGVNGEAITARHYVIHPAMRHAYMAAKATAAPEDGGVTLTFKPLVAAVEMTLVNNSVHTDVNNNKSGITLSDVTLINLTVPRAVCGGFKYDFNEITNVSTDQSYHTVGIPVQNADGSAITLNYGDKITFTAFMLLPADLSQISVSIVAGGITKSATLQGKNGVNIIQAEKKNFINNVKISLDEVEEVTLSNWLEALDPSLPLNQLSIPGAGGAASKLLSTEYDKQQTLSIDELWERGIRCFEFMCDRGDGLGSEKVICGTTPVDMTLNEAVNAVANKIKANPMEFGVVIIGYQDEDVDTYDRNAGDNTPAVKGWGGEFHRWWNSYSFSGTSTVNGQSITHAKKELTSTTTVGEARGKLFCIVRPMGIGIDGGWYTGVADGINGGFLNLQIVNSYNSTNGPYVCALGWGSHPDQWYARGYGNLVTANGTSFTANAGGVADRPYEVNPTSVEDEEYTIPTKKSFAYKFVNKADTPWSSISELCWVQDWRRVAPDATLREQYGIKAVTEAEGVKGFNNRDNESWEYKWYPSADEKWEDIETTLQMSMEDKEGKYSLYINSLCGYFVDGDIPLSFQPRPTFQRYTSSNTYYLDDKYNTTDYVGEANLVGSSSRPELGKSWGPYNTKGGNEGNIAAYADWVNNKFYNLLLTKMANGEMTGPTGIVIMDRVSATSANPAGFYIPQIIIGNNFNAAATNIDITYSTYDNGRDQAAAPERR